MTSIFKRRRPQGAGEHRRPLPPPLPGIFFIQLARYRSYYSKMRATYKIFLKSDFYSIGLNFRYKIVFRTSRFGRSWRITQLTERRKIVSSKNSRGSYKKSSLRTSTMFTKRTRTMLPVRLPFTEFFGFRPPNVSKRFETFLRGPEPRTGRNIIFRSKPKKQTRCRLVKRVL